MVQDVGRTSVEADGPTTFSPLSSAIRRSRGRRAISFGEWRTCMVSSSTCGRGRLRLAASLRKRSSAPTPSWPSYWRARVEKLQRKERRYSLVQPGHSHRSCEPACGAEACIGELVGEEEATFDGLEPAVGYEALEDHAGEEAQVLRERR